MMMRRQGPVRELRVALTVGDYERGLRFYRDGLGLPVLRVWDEPSGSGAILDAGRATLEVISTSQAELIDRIEVGERIAGPVRLALEVDDSAAMAEALSAAGAEVLAGPVVTPWSHRNVRLRTPDDMQLTLFTVLDRDRSAAFAGDAEAAAARWVDGWSRAWPEKDADLVASLYADDSIFRSLPFRDPHVGSSGARDYARWAFDDQADVRCWFGQPVAGPGNRAVVEYWAVLTTIAGDVVTVAGCSVLRFGAHGRVAEQRDYWVQEDGAVEPPEGWGS
jgi:lactoylglutathione lyase